MRNGKKLVLIVEDLRMYQEDWYFQLHQVVEILPATSIEEAQAQFTANAGDIDAIVMDACVPGDSPTTPPLVEELRRTFIGPMIAASGAPEYRTILMRAGCSHQARKDDVPRVVRQVLAIA